MSSIKSVSRTAFYCIFSNIFFFVRTLKPPQFKIYVFSLDSIVGDFGDGHDKAVSFSGCHLRVMSYLKDHSLTEQTSSSPHVDIAHTVFFNVHSVNVGEHILKL